MKIESFQEIELSPGDSNTEALRTGMFKLCEDLKEETRDGEHQDSSNTKPLPVLGHDSSWD